VRVAVLVKQVPSLDSLALQPDGRLQRVDVPLEMNAYCRRAVSKGVQIARSFDGTCTVFTLGPPSAEDVLREAVAWGADCGILVSDPRFAGSDTLATAKALSAALRLEGPFDLILTGRNSVDADTGQVGPQVAELLDLPFAGGVRQLRMERSRAWASSELDDGWRESWVELPALLSVAERLCEPAKVKPDQRALVNPSLLSHLTAADLGSGPWGADASPTSVGKVRMIDVTRRGVRPTGTLLDQITQTVDLLHEWGAIGSTDATSCQDSGASETDRVPLMYAPLGWGTGPVAVVAEPGCARVTRELLGEAAVLARRLQSHVVVLGHPSSLDAAIVGQWGADACVTIEGGMVEEDIAETLSGWCIDEEPWAVLLPSSLWGREVAGRLAVRLDAGLTGDAVGLGIDGDRLISWKPAFGGRLVAAITTRSAVQLVTVRAGVLPVRPPRDHSRTLSTSTLLSRSRGRVKEIAELRDPQVESFLSAETVIGIGAGVKPQDLDCISPLAEALGAQIAATRKVTDQGWLPRGRQVGITGHSIAPKLYVALGVAGKFNHVIGVQSAGVIVAVNSDPNASIFEWADVGIVADWQDVVKPFTEAVSRPHQGRPARPHE
jgi:electron transfer flavoprotein alpha subunit